MNKKTDDIQLLILDVDGTLTDGGVYVTQDGTQFKKYNAKDGLGIRQLVKAGKQVGIISHSMVSEMVTARAEVLGIQNCYVGMEDKLVVLDQWCSELGISREQIAYIGDDINDLGIMQAVGISACPSDAHDKILAIADIKLSRKGGEGAVREFIDNYMLND
jgi:3-deoxy-D-manno-octulosonate 8-phosphate phosphatase (KDO 8-P phosphatase)